MKELENLIKNTKNNSAPGLDGITYESLKILPERGICLLLNLINCILTLHDTPASLKQMEMIILHKNGDPMKLENYRGIALLNVPFKMASAIINKRKSIMKENIKLFTDAQGGGRPGRTCGHKGPN